MVPEKGAPGLTAATLQVLWAVLRDGPRRDPPAELRELASDPVFPRRRFSRHIRRMRSRNSASIGGRPTRRRERKRHQ
jgi:hypothetical protein